MSKALKSVSSSSGISKLISESGMPNLSVSLSEPLLSFEKSKLSSKSLSEISLIPSKSKSDEKLFCDVPAVSKSSNPVKKSSVLFMLNILSYVSVYGVLVNKLFFTSVFFTEIQND